MSQHVIDEALKLFDKYDLLMIKSALIPYHEKLINDRDKEQCQKLINYVNYVLGLMRKGICEY